MAKIWFDGHFANDNEPLISATDRGFTLGDGLFETVRMEQGHIFYFDKHLNRLSKSLLKLGIPFKYEKSDLEDAMKELKRLNGLNENKLAFRLTVSRGSGPRGLAPPSPPSPHVMISVAPAISDLPPAKLCYSTFNVNEDSPSSGLKTTSYIDQVIAFEQARKQNCDEAVLFNSKGMVAEGTMSNLFFLIEDQIITPGLWCGAIPGVMRDVLMELDPSIVETEITREQVEAADEIFMTNSLIKIRPVSQLERKTFSETPKTIELMEKLHRFETNKRI